jgi:SAM-dependent methyltransferase
VRRSADQAQWAAAADGFGAAVERYYAARGRDGADAALRATIRTNTELVPQRADMLLRLLQRLGGRSNVTGARIVEAGCGFGALAGYLAWRTDCASVLAFDVRDDLVDAARDSAGPLGVGDRLVYEPGDMRTFGPVPDAWADVVVLNNAFIYLPTAADMALAVTSLRRAVAPGGHVVVYHANRWRSREPFSGDPLVHLLPPRLADAVSRRTGWKHNHGRVRLLSPPRMAWMLRRAGFEHVRIGGWRRSAFVTGPRAYPAPYYGVVARAPRAPSGGR